MKWIIPVITAVLGAYGGAEGTSLAWRRVGIPIVVWFYFGSSDVLWRTVSSLLMAVILSLGYGEDSFLRKRLKRDLVVRGLIGALLSISLIPIVASIGALYVRWIIGAIILMVVWSVFGGDDVVKNEGIVVCCGKKLLVEDLILYGTLGGYLVWIKSV